MMFEMRKWMKHIRMLYRYRYLLWMWTLREIRVRYKQSILGGAWAILQPLSLAIIFTVVFSVFARVPTDGVPYPIFAYAALLPWTLLATAVSFAVPSLVNNMNLVTKTYFPREILPLAVTAAAFIDFCVASTIFAVMLAFYRVPVHWTLIWVPLLIGVQIILILGITFVGSAVSVFFRDVRFVVPLGLQLWLYATPVIYPESLVPERLHTLYMLNPMAGLIASYRRVILRGLSPVPLDLGLAVGLSITLFIVAYWFFKRVERQFADII
jgi:lipopolysaccharide transport system permease protein